MVPQEKESLKMVSDIENQMKTFPFYIEKKKRSKEMRIITAILFSFY